MGRKRKVSDSEVMKRLSTRTGNALRNAGMESNIVKHLMAIDYPQRWARRTKYMGQRCLLEIACFLEDIKYVKNKYDWLRRGLICPHCGKSIDKSCGVFDG